MTGNSPTLRFRAVLHDPGDATAERPVQMFCNDWAEVTRWTAIVLKRAKSPDAIVRTYEAIEIPRTVFSKELAAPAKGA